MISIGLLFTLLLCLTYVLIQLFYVVKWNKIACTPSNNNTIGSAKITVVIAARNAEKTIESCLNSIRIQDYPMDSLEIILVNDHSNDKTVSLALKLGMTNLKVINLPEETYGKKQAVKRGIQEAQGDLIFFTDADCILPENWLKVTSALFDNEKVGAVSGAVMPFHADGGLLDHFQQLDFAGMMVITAVALKHRLFALGNGANLAIRKSAFDPDSMDWNWDNASGDDIALVKHMLNRGYDLIFLKHRSSIVYTQPAPSWKSFFMQRIRWGTKNKSSHQFIQTVHLGIVYLMSLLNVVIYVWLVMVIAGYGSWHYMMLLPVLFKMLGDILILYSGAGFYNCSKSLIYFPLLEIIHSGYITIVGTASLFQVKFSWKGRSWH